MWKLLQLGIFVAVVGSNIEYQWTPNMYLPSLLGVAAAAIATALIIKASELLRWLFRALQKASHYGRL